MALDTQQEVGTVPWHIKGELILNCNCTVFCPCVVSLGKHAPTEGYCQTWFGVRIDDGAYGDEDLSGLNVGMLVEIPGLMARGNWTAAAFIDERASEPGISTPWFQHFHRQSGEGHHGPVSRILVSNVSSVRGACAGGPLKAMARRGACLVVPKKIQSVRWNPSVASPRGRRHGPDHQHPVLDGIRR